VVLLFAAARFCRRWWRGGPEHRSAAAVAARGAEWPYRPRVAGARMRRMPSWTCAFYVFVALLVALPLPFVWSVWHEARTRGWAWTSVDSRSMYVDGAKTLVTASGIAVALLASSGVAAARTASALVAFSAKVAAVSLIFCVCTSIGLIVVLLRFYERAWSRRGDELRAAGQSTSVREGKLNALELLVILAFSEAAFTSFLVGFAFLGRIAFHF
jgi:hypothetical protein